MGRRRKRRNEFSGRRHARKELRNGKTELRQNMVNKGRSRRSKDCGCAAGCHGLTWHYASSSIHCTKHRSGGLRKLVAQSRPSHGGNKEGIGLAYNNTR